MPYIALDLSIEYHWSPLVGTRYAIVQCGLFENPMGNSFRITIDIPPSGSRLVGGNPLVGNRLKSGRYTYTAQLSSAFYFGRVQSRI